MNNSLIRSYFKGMLVAFSLLIIAMIGFQNLNAQPEGYCINTEPAWDPNYSYHYYYCYPTYITDLYPEYYDWYFDQTICEVKITGDDGIKLDRNSGDEFEACYVLVEDGPFELALGQTYEIYIRRPRKKEFTKISIIFIQILLLRI